MLKNIKNRWQAFTCHLVLSALVVTTLITLAAWFWFPGELITFGGWEGLTILAAVDITLGPVLTAIVFDTQKKSLKFDLFIIFLLQIGALTYGFWVIEKQRPIVAVLLDNSVYLIAKSEFVQQGIPVTTFKDYKGRPPYPVILDLPNNKQAIVNAVTQSLFSGIPIELNHNKYLQLRLADNNPQILSTIDWHKKQANYSDKKNCAEVEIRSAFKIANGCLDLTTFRITEISAKQS